MRAPLLLLVALLLAPAASARAPGESYRDEARGLFEEMEESVRRARVATVEHAFGDRDARATAHVMRVEGARLALLVTQLDGMEPPRALAREHATFRQAAEWYAEALAFLQPCFRHDDADACRAGSVRIGWGEAYRPLVTSAFS